MYKRTVGINCKKKHLIMIDNKRCEIKTKKKKTAWKLLKEYINSLPQGTSFTRKELLNHIYTVDVSTIDVSVSVDYYKGFLNKLGFITTYKPGVYIKQKHIPMKLTLQTVRKAAQDNSWKTWFVALHDRLGLDENELLQKERLNNGKFK